jgi:hypothetical protein
MIMNGKRCRRGENLVNYIWSCQVHWHVKIKFSLEQDMRAQRGSRGIALLACAGINVFIHIKLPKIGIQDRQ